MFTIETVFFLKWDHYVTKIFFFLFFLQGKQMITSKANKPGRAGTQERGLLSLHYWILCYNLWIILSSFLELLVIRLDVSGDDGHSGHVTGQRALLAGSEKAFGSGFASAHQLSKMQACPGTSDVRRMLGCICGEAVTTKIPKWSAWDAVHSQVLVTSSICMTVHCIKKSTCRSPTDRILVLFEGRLQYIRRNTIWKERELGDVMKASLLCRILGRVIHIKMRLCKMPGTEN